MALSPELIAWVSQDIGATVQPQTADEWVCLLENAGLENITVRMHPVMPKKEVSLLLGRYGYDGMIGSGIRALNMCLRNPAYRRFVKRVSETGVIPDNLAEYFG